MMVERNEYEWDVIFLTTSMIMIIRLYRLALLLFPPAAGRRAGSWDQHCSASD